MIEKSPELRMREKVDEMMESFRASVRKAQRSSLEAGVPIAIKVMGKNYHLMPDGEMVLIAKQPEPKSE